MSTATIVEFSGEIINATLVNGILIEWDEHGCETVELVKMKSLIESKHQKIPFYDCNLTTPGYFLLGRMLLLKTSKIRAWRESEDERTEKGISNEQQQKRSRAAKILESHFNLR